MRNINGMCVNCGLSKSIDKDGKTSYGVRSVPFKGNYDAWQAESFSADVKHQCGKCGKSYANLTVAEKCCTESNTIKYGLYGLAALGGISLLSYLKK